MKTVGLVLYIILFVLFLSSLGACTKGAKISKGLKKQDIVVSHNHSGQEDSEEHRIFLEMLSEK